MRHLSNVLLLLPFLSLSLACGSASQEASAPVAAPEPQPVEEVSEPVAEESLTSSTDVPSEESDSATQAISGEGIEDTTVPSIPADPEPTLVEEPNPAVPQEQSPESSESNEAASVEPTAEDLYWSSIGQLNSDLDYDSALETAQKLLESDQSGFAKFDVAILLDRKGDSEQALALLDQVIAANVPASIAALDAKLSVLTRQGRGTELETYLRENWKDTVETIPYAAILGRMLLDQGKLEQVFKLSLAILRLQEKSAPALALIGRYYIRKDNPDLAKVALRDSIAISDTSDIVHYELGMLYLKEEKLRWAMNEFEAASLLAPHVPEYRNNLGVLQTELGAFLAAITNLEAAVKLEPTHPGYHLNLGTAYRGDQRFLDAKGLYEKALELDSTLFDAHFNIGILLMENEIEGLVLENEEVTTAYSDFEAKDLATLIRLKKALWHLEQYGTQAQPSGDDLAKLEEYSERALSLVTRTEDTLSRMRKRREREAKRAARKAKREAEERAEAAANGETDGDGVNPDASGTEQPEDSPSDNGDETSDNPEGAVSPDVEAPSESGNVAGDQNAEESVEATEPDTESNSQGESGSDG